MKNASISSKMEFCSEKVGIRIKRAREKVGYLTQAEFANVLSINQASLSRWEQGTTLPPSDKLVLLSTKLNISIDYLLTGVEPQNRTLSDELGFTNEFINEMKKEKKVKRESYSYPISDFAKDIESLYWDEEKREVFTMLMNYLNVDYSRIFVEKEANKGNVTMLPSNELWVKREDNDESISLNKERIRGVFLLELINKIEKVGKRVEKNVKER